MTKPNFWLIEKANTIKRQPRAVLNGRTEKEALSTDTDKTF